MTIEPLVKTTDVPCSQEKAFTVFLNEMETWWPLGKFTVSAMKGEPAKNIRVDAKVGGRIVEVGADDTEVEWGTIEEYDPYGYVRMAFHIPSPDEVEMVTERTTVEVRFTPTGDDSTHVELTQSNWEALLVSSKHPPESIRGGYNPGWNMLLGAFTEKCGE